MQLYSESFFHLQTSCNDLFDKMPDKVSELESIWKQWANRTGVRTWGTKEEILNN